MPFRILFICLILSVLCACAAKKPPQEPVVEEVVVEEEVMEPLDKELTEDWPLVGDVELTEAERTALEAKLDFPYPLNDYSAKLIQEQFLFLTRRVPRTIRNWVNRSEPYLPFIFDEIKEAGLPIELAYLPFIESGFNPRAYSRAGAAGMWQFMAATGRKFGLRRDMWVDERRDPYASTQAAAKYLKRLHEMLGEWTLAVASYNAGEAKIMKAAQATGSNNFFELSERNHTLPYKLQLRKETLEFVPRLLAMAKLMNNLEELGFREPDEAKRQKVARLRIGPRVNLKALAKACGLSWKDFRNLNPAFRRSATPPKGEFWASIPLSKESAAKEYLSKPQPKPDYEGLTTYKVKRGDTWSHIAARAGVRVSLIKEANNTRSDMLRPGDIVYVPIPLGGESDEIRTPARKKKSAPPVPGEKYVIKRGETLSHIADRTLVPVKVLMQANNLRSPKSLRAGQTIIIPKDAAKKPKLQPGGDPLAKPKGSEKQAASGKTYRVRNGDTLWNIARRHKVSVAELMRWNNLKKNAVLRPGDILTVEQ